MGDSRGGATLAVIVAVAAVVAWVREHTIPILSAISGFGVAAIFGVIVLGAEATRFESTQFLVNLYKFLIGLFCVAASLYLYYGPAIREMGYLERLMPAGDIPASVVVMYFVIGGSVIMTSSALLTDHSSIATFWKGIGFSSIFAIAVGYLVYQLMVVQLNENGGEPLTDGGRNRSDGRVTGSDTVIELPHPVGIVTYDEYHASVLGGLAGVVAGFGLLLGLFVPVFWLTIALLGALGIIGVAKPEWRIPYSQRVMRREAWYFLGGYILIAMVLTGVGEWAQ